MIAIAIATATVVSFIASAVLYGLPPVSALITRTSTPRPGVPVGLQMALVAFRSFVVACLLAGLMNAANWDGSAAGALLGLCLATIAAVLLLGAVIHDNASVSAAAVHLFDWTVKLTIIGAIVGAFI